MSTTHDSRATEGPSADKPATVCTCLRTKMQYVTPEGTWGRPSSTAQFWCLHTMGAIGPDDGPARPELCNNGRVCHETEL